MLSSITAAHLSASSDYRVRLRASELRGLSFTHLFSMSDPSVQDDALRCGIRCSLAGITEWQAMHARGAITLGWDWVLLDDGPAILRCVPPRTNLMLLDTQGYDVCDDAAGQFALVESLPWKAAVLSALHQLIH